MTVPVIGKEYLQPNDDEIKRAANKDEYLFSEVFHDVKINENNAPLQVGIVSDLLTTRRRANKI